MKPLKHQEKFAKDYEGKRLLVHEGGTGKTVCACLWLADLRDTDALVVCPKRVVKKWQKALKDWGTEATVLSKEEFKKHPLKEWSAVVIDEADEFASPLFTKGRSQLSEKMYDLVKEYKPLTLLLSATPVRSNPWNLHTLLCFMGVYIDWKKWREHFFSLEYRPYLPRPAWLPRPDWRERTVPFIEKYGDIVLLSECVGTLPPKIIEKVDVPVEKGFKLGEWEPTKAFYEEHRHEQKLKVKVVLEVAKDYRKVLVVAYYREQIQELEKALSKERKTYAVWGDTKKQEEILTEANEYQGECFLIVQASLGAGFDANTFSCVVFVSMSYAVRDYVQMGFRVRRIHDLRPVKFYHLLAGRCDKAIYENVEKGKTFVPSEWSP